MLLDEITAVVGDVCQQRGIICSSNSVNGDAIVLALKANGNESLLGVSGLEVRKYGIEPLRLRAERHCENLLRSA